MNAVRSNNLSCKYQSLKLSGCKDIVIQKIDLVAMTQLILLLYIASLRRKWIKTSDFPECRVYIN